MYCTLQYLKCFYSAKVFSETERFWSLTNRSRVPLSDEFDLQLDLRERDVSPAAPAPAPAPLPMPAAASPSDAPAAAASESSSSASEVTSSSRAQPSEPATESGGEAPSAPVAASASSEYTRFKFHLQRVTSRSQPLVQRRSTTENEPNGAHRTVFAFSSTITIVIHTRTVLY